MDKFPLLWKGKHVGELTTEREALYTWFTARCRLPEEGLWCAWIVGEHGEVRLGVLEPAGQQAAIRRKFSDRMSAPLGKILRGEVRSASGGDPGWEPVSEPDRLFRTPWLRRELRGMQGAMTRRESERRYLALLYDKGKAFPLVMLFCFASIKRIGGQEYAVFAFDEKEWPVQSGNTAVGPLGTSKGNARKNSGNQ